LIVGPSLPAQDERSTRSYMQATTTGQLPMCSRTTGHCGRLNVRSVIRSASERRVLDTNFPSDNVSSQEHGCAQTSREHDLKGSAYGKCKVKGWDDGRGDTKLRVR